MNTNKKQRQIFTFLASVMLAGCQMTPNPTYDINVNSKFYNTEIPAGTYVLAINKFNNEADLNNQTLGPSIECGEYITDTLDARGFRRVYNQQNADYIITFNCNFTVNSIDNGYKSTPNYGLDVTTSNSLITSSSDSGQLRTHSTSIGSKVTSMDIKKSMTNFVSSQFSIGIYYNHDSFSHYDRELLWHAMANSTTWNGHPDNKKVASYEDIVFTTFDSFYLKETVGDFYTNKPKTITRPYIAPTEESNNDDLFLYYLELENNSRYFMVSYEQFAHEPWQTTYFKGERASLKAKNGFKFESLFTYTKDIKSGSTSASLVYYGDSWLLALDRSRFDLTKGYEMYIYDGYSRRKIEPEITHRVNSAVQFTSDELVKMLSSNQGMRGDFVKIVFPDFGLEIPFRKEGFQDGLALSKLTQ